LQASIIITFLFWPLPLFPKQLSQAEAEKFIQTLIHNNKAATAFVAPEELRIANRLGISYEGVAQKFFIAYNIEAALREKLKNQIIDYQATVHHLSKSYARLDFKVENADYARQFFFKNSKLIAPITYYSKNWKTLQSDYFDIFVSDSTLFNSSCVKYLDNFFESAAHLLQFNQKQLAAVRREKIRYYLCKDPNEIKQITGFDARGIYNLANDAIITIFNAHFHELMHLLVNLKLGKLPLFTHPFFQEGFAVATGGRGGRAVNVVLNLGRFLHQSEMLQYEELLNKQEFARVNSSMSYPASGLYNAFLLKMMRIDEYLKLYKKYSGTSKEVAAMQIAPQDLPSREALDKFIQQDCNARAIEPGTPNFAKQPLLFSDSSMKTFEDEQWYYIFLRNNFLFGSEEKFHDYRSEKFTKLSPGRQYAGEKYWIEANNNEVSIYNLLTNNLIAGYVSSFTTSGKQVPREDGFYQFRVAKTVFEEKLTVRIFQK